MFGRQADLVGAPRLTGRLSAGGPRGAPPPSPERSASGPVETVFVAAVARRKGPEDTGAERARLVSRAARPATPAARQVAALQGRLTAAEAEAAAAKLEAAGLRQVSSTVLP